MTRKVLFAAVLLILVSTSSLVLAKDDPSTTPSPPPTSTEVTPEQEPEISRNPYTGFVIGDPIILGVMENHEVNVTDADASSEEDSGSKGKGTRAKKPVIVYSQKKTNFLSIHHQGSCRLTKNRIQVKFGINHWTECSLTLDSSLTCNSLQSQITELLLGSNNFNFSIMHTSILPTPLSNSTEHWVPLVVQNMPEVDIEATSSPNSTFGCDAIVPSLHIHILYDYFGNINFPQAKITGVMYDFGDMFNTPKFEKAKTASENSLLAPKLRLTTRVTFTPINVQVTRKIPQWPSLSLHLPKDFFYPFSHLASGGGSSVSQVGLVPVLIFLGLVSCLV